MTKRTFSQLDTPTSIHHNGYEVFRDTIIIPEGLEEQLLSYGRQGNIIFNHHETRIFNDRRRRQTNLNRVNRQVANFRNTIQDFLTTHFPNLVPTDWVTIYSNSGCGDQAAHCDYVPDSILATTPDSHFPLGALVAVMPETRIHVWPGSHRLAYLSTNVLSELPPITRETVSLDPGDILVFRGDLIHAGANYSEENSRVHCFLDSPQVPRTANRTWLIYQDGTDELRKKILV